jgi:hypothetical protein
MKLTQKKAKRELEIMNMIGDSAFKLVAYVTFYLIHEFVWTLGSTFVVPQLF